MNTLVKELGLFTRNLQNSIKEVHYIKIKSAEQSTCLRFPGIAEKYASLIEYS